MSKKNSNKAEETENKIIDANFKEVDDTETNNEVPVDDNASGEQKEESEKKQSEETKPGFLKKAWAVTKKVAPYIGGAAIGAAAMYFLGKKDGNVIVDVPFKEIPMPETINRAVETVADSLPKLADNVQASTESFKLEEIPTEIK